MWGKRRKEKEKNNKIGITKHAWSIFSTLRKISGSLRVVLQYKSKGYLSICNLHWSATVILELFLIFYVLHYTILNLLSTDIGILYPPLDKRVGYMAM